MIGLARLRGGKDKDGGERIVEMGGKERKESGVDEIEEMKKKMGKEMKGMKRWED